LTHPAGSEAEIAARLDAVMKELAALRGEIGRRNPPA
jgi:hypothetical protein